MWGKCNVDEKFALKKLRTWTTLTINMLIYKYNSGIFNQINFKYLNGTFEVNNISVYFSNIQNSLLSSFIAQHLNIAAK